MPQMHLIYSKWKNIVNDSDEYHITIIKTYLMVKESNVMISEHRFKGGSWRVFLSKCFIYSCVCVYIIYLHKTKQMTKTIEIAWLKFCSNTWWNTWDVMEHGVDRVTKNMLSQHWHPHALTLATDTIHYLKLLKNPSWRPVDVSFHLWAEKVTKMRA